MTSVTHDEAINVLRNAGSEVHLTVKHYRYKIKDLIKKNFSVKLLLKNGVLFCCRSAAPFLLKNVRQLIPDLEPTSPIQPQPDLPAMLEQRKVPVPVLDSPCSVNSDGSTSWNGIPRVRRKWIDVVEGNSFYFDIYVIYRGNQLQIGNQ